MQLLEARDYIITIKQQAVAKHFNGCHMIMMTVFREALECNVIKLIELFLCDPGIQSVITGNTQQVAVVRKFHY